MEYAVETRDLVKSYGHSRALNGLTMQLPKGAIYGLVGRNGAGKTTLIRLLCGLQRPTAGSYSLYGCPCTDPRLARIRRRVGAVVETPSIYLDLTAADNLKAQYRILGVPSDDGIPALLKLVDLADTGKKKARHFSLGMKQRLGIAVALAGEPDLLVLDEPTNGLDPQGIVEMRELILKLNRERGITVLISSHILDELSRLATHYGFIDGGRMCRQLSAQQLEEAGRKCTRLDVSDVQVLARVLDGMGVGYQILSDTRANVFSLPDLTGLVLALDAQGCKVHAAHEQDESLESYFVNLVGGGCLA